MQDPDDPQSSIIWTWTDITSQHATNEALAVETLRLSALLECFPGGVLMVDADDTVVFVNSGWLRQTRSPHCRTGAAPGSSTTPSQVTVSAINWNFPGRSGPGSVWLASPPTVVASALAGELVSFAELQAIHG